MDAQATQGNNMQDFVGRITATKQGFKALDQRGEKERRGLLQNIPGIGGYFDQKNKPIDMAGANLSKYYGSKVIDAEVSNQQNRYALQTMFADNIHSSVGSIVETARKSGDMVSVIKAMQLGAKLNSIPFDKLDTKTVYGMLDDLNKMGRSVIGGANIGDAISSSDTARSLSDKHQDYMDKIEEERYQRYDENAETFFKGLATGSITTVAHTLDSVMNLAMYATDNEQFANMVTKTLQNIIPDMTDAEKRSLSAKSGAYVGELGSLVGMFGVPKSPTDLITFLAFPKIIEASAELFGMSEKQVDISMGLLVSRDFGHKVSSMYKDFSTKSGKSMRVEVDPQVAIENTFNKSMEYANSKETNRAKSDAVNEIFEGSQERIESEIERGTLPTDPTNRLADALMDGDYGSDLYNSNVTEMGEREAQAVHSLEQSGDASDVAYVKEREGAIKQQVMSSAEKAIHGQEPIKDSTQISENFRDGVVELVDAVQENVSKKLYDPIDIEISNIQRNVSNYDIPVDFSKNVSEDFTRITDETIYSTTLPDGVESEFTSADTVHATGVPKLGERLSEVWTAFKDGKPKDGLSLLSELTSRVGEQSRNLKGASDRSLRLAQGAYSKMKLLKSRMYNSVGVNSKIVELIDKIGNADTVYAKTKGKINEIVNRGPGNKSAKRKVQEMSSSQLVNLAKNPEFCKELTNLSSTMSAVFEKGHTSASPKIFEAFNKVSQASKQAFLKDDFKHLTRTAISKILNTRHNVHIIGESGMNTFRDLLGRIDVRDALQHQYQNPSSTAKRLQRVASDTVQGIARSVPIIGDMAVNAVKDTSLKKARSYLTSLDRKAPENARAKAIANATIWHDKTYARKKQAEDENG